MSRRVQPVELSMPMIVCIGCGCTETQPCIARDLASPLGWVACSWTAIDEDTGMGLCSTCAVKPLDELVTRRPAPLAKVASA